MKPFSQFVSIVVVLHNQEQQAEAVVGDISGAAQAAVKEYEIVLVDNASTDGTVGVLERLVQEFANVQVHCLVQPCDLDVATIAGLENCIGDYAVVFDAGSTALQALPGLLDLADAGNDAVFLVNPTAANTGNWTYRLLRRAFGGLYRRLTGRQIPPTSARNRVLNRRIVNYLLQQANASLLYRVMPAHLAGFKHANMQFDVRDVSPAAGRRGLLREFQNGISILLSGSSAPMRLMTLLCLFGAVFNVVYTGYVASIFIFKEEVAPGWVTLSLQMAAMFFLFSLVLAILSEYLLRVLATSLREPGYYVGRQFSSETLSRHDKLNVLRESRFIDRNHTRD